MPERYRHIEERSEKETRYIDSCMASSDRDSIQGMAIKGTYNLISDLKRVDYASEGASAQDLSN